MNASENMGAGGVKRYTTCSTAGPMFVSVADGRIIRVEPMQFEPEEVDSWQIDVNGKTYKPPLTHPLLPWGMVAKQMNYSENRVNYPLKRVDWNPEGERNAHNRGTSGYERISWDEAYDIMEKEMRRTIATYGPSAFCQGFSAHPEWGSLHYLFSDSFRFWHMIGSTLREFTPNSWEGWACGATFLWGIWMGHGLPPAEDTLQDISEESELIVIWGNDPMFHNVYNGVDSARAWRYWKELGKKVVMIEPLLNETGMFAADKWIQIRPGTDVAMAAAIAYVWISEGTYDKAYLDTHAVGFDEAHLPLGAPAGLSFKSYILGESDDATPKTPEWASKICGVPERVIVTLAREWASKPTSLWAMEGGACRREFAHEFARMMGTLQVMQGLGKPGVNIIGTGLSLGGPYDGHTQLGPTGYADGGMNVVLENYYPNQVPQKITFQKLLDCVENPPQHWQGGHIDNFNPEMFFEEMDYPAPGCSEIHFLWQRGSTLTNPPDHKRDIRAYLNEKIETFVVAAPWFDRDCRYADLVLPITTIFERQDLTEPGSVGQYVPPAYIGLRSAVFHQRSLDPSGESKTDLAIFEELAQRLGYGEQFMEGNTEDTLLEKMYAKTNIPMEYEDFKEKGYYVWPAPPNYVRNKQFSGFYADPVAHPCETPTGKIEIFSTLLWEKYGYNAQIPPVPHYIPEIEGYGSTDLKAKYPLQMLMAHPKFRFHGKYNDCSWLTENYKVYGPDGYGYEPVWMTPADAGARGLVEGDIVRCFNDRGEVLAGVRVTERLIPGVSWLTYGSWNDPLDSAIGSLDRGGDGNCLSNAGPMSIHHVGGAYNSTLFEVEKADLAALAAKYPEGWAGKYSTWNRKG
ncbi:MAG: molybdopterin-dependent oxidoreductase [Coriobacteriia bacterium]|nr:molybdopterin-dependent oxidoreductase [Coriobacteriia bacterium]